MKVKGGMAQMAVLRVDHPDIEMFVTSKRNDKDLTRYNISVGVTDEFMECLIARRKFPLQFEGKIYSYIDPVYLWDLIMRSTWDWAEPGVLFLDSINNDNNLYYCETIAASNPCGEQPLPPNGACLLGSLNLVKYITIDYVKSSKSFKYSFDWDLFKDDIALAVRATDNVIDKTGYPLPEQEVEAKAKRRMGLGICGLANALEVQGMPYASPEFIKETKKIMRILRDTAYETSTELAEEKGSFPLFDAEKYLQSGFAKRLPKRIQDLIRERGLRNSHLISIAPTGTISFCADNVSSGIEPPFSLYYDRRMVGIDGGERTVRVEDYAYRVWGIKSKCADDLSPQEHMSVQVACQPYVDSAISKTCNVGSNVSWEDFKSLYLDAWKAGLKGITTFRSAGERYGILNKVEEQEETGEACFIDPTTGEKECG
jgi:ribonucleoside-diphosphate reductase alpha chain